MAVGKSCSLFSPLPSLPHFYFVFLLIYFSTFLSVLSFFLPFFFLLLFPLASLGLLSASQATSKARNNLLKCIFVSSKRTRVFSSIFPPFFGQRVTRKYAAKLRQRLTFIITIRYHRFEKMVRAIRSFERAARKRIPLMSSATFPVKITLTFLHRT